MGRSEHLEFEIVKKRVLIFLFCPVVVYLVFQDGKVLEYMRIQIMGTPLYTGLSVKK
jgi:hypothetical protein